MKSSLNLSALMLILSVIAALSLACGPSASPTSLPPVSGSVPPLSTALPTPSPTPAASAQPAITPTSSASGESVSPDTASANLPGWLDRMLRELESQPPANPPLSVTRYEYRGQVVYYQTATCCDIFSNLYDEDGELIAHPDGGITGQGDGRSPDFFQERERESLVWRDAREPLDKDRHPVLAAPLLAPIDSIELQIAESFPLQYFLTVVSGLPDGCHSFGGYTLTRDGHRVLIKVLNLKPSDTLLMCIMVYGTVETVIPLGSDFDPNETYTIDVNGKTISFRGDAILEETLKATPTPSAPAIPSLAELREELLRNRELWETQGIADYQMEFRWICFCPPDYVAPVIISVNRGDTNDSVVFAENGLRVDRRYSADYPTIDGLFDLIQGAINRPAFHISVRYHAELGYPLSAAIDYDQRIMDEEKAFRVFAVTKIK